MRQPGTAPGGAPDRPSDGRPSARGSLAVGLVSALALVVTSHPVAALGVALGATGTVAAQRVLRRVGRSRDPARPGRSAAGGHRRASPRR